MRRLLLGAAIVLAAAVLGACGRQVNVGTPQGGTGPRPVIASDVYAHRVGADQQRAKLAGIESVVVRLRTDSGSSGWQARQDDTTGDAAELAGGVLVAPEGTSAIGAVRSFLLSYGAAFGLTDPTVELTIPDELPVGDDGSATFRSPQMYRGIPVDGAQVLVPVDRVDRAAEISLARARVFSGINVPTTPSIPEDDARQLVEGVAGAPATGAFSLVIYTRTATPVLAWRTDLQASGDDATPTTPGGIGLSGIVAGPSRLFLDATTGALLEVRPLSLDILGPGTRLRMDLEAAAAPPTYGGVHPQARGEGPFGELGNRDVDLPPPGNPVAVSGVVVGGRDVSVATEQLTDGSVAMIDASDPNADRATGANVLTVHDGSGISPNADLGEIPGPVLRFSPTEAPSQDALTAAWAAREVVDYFRTEHGRDGWDEARSPLPSTVHIPNPPGTCEVNGAFLTLEGKSQMLYGDPCVRRDGTPLVATWVDIGIVAHEVMHGVTHTNARELGDTVQTGAVDEGTSDYFGVVIQNRVLGENWTTVGALACEGVGESPACIPQEDGNRGIRNVNTGTTFDDYEFVLEEPLGLAGKTIDALHENALIYTNALWRIRTTFAAQDGGDLNNSEAARRFDRVVYRATVRYFTESTDFLAAAEAIERAAAEVPGVTAAERDIIRRQFQLSKLCRGCTFPAETARPVAISPGVKTRPFVTDAGVGYTEYTGRLASRSFHSVLDAEHISPLSPEGLLTLFAVGAGGYSAELVVDIAGDRGVVNLRDVATGEVEELTTDPFPFTEPAISRDAVAWVEATGPQTLTVAWREIAGGPVLTLDVPAPPSHIAVDGSRVALQFPDGLVAVWETSADDVARLAVLPETPEFPGVLLPPGGLAIQGDRVAAIAFNGDIDNWLLVVLTRDGRGSIISDRASPFGVTMNGDLVVWGDNVGIQPSRVAQLSGSRLADIDIEAYSFATDTFYRIFPLRGQQGYPHFDGDRLTWQDSILGGNDIFTVRLPQGL